jgi:hypothetical protein
MTPEQPPQNPGQTPPDQITQQVQHSRVSARVPEKIGRGTFATHALILTGNQELCLDFLLRMAPPYLLAARVILPYSTLGPLIQAIGENLENYRQRFGNAPPALPPPPPNAPQPNLADVYEQLKITDEVSVGAYANTLMISHSPSEFCLDFILDMFPRSVVTQRVYMAAPQIPPLLNTLKRTFEQLQQRLAQQQHPPQPPPQG